MKLIIPGLRRSVFSYDYPAIVGNLAWFVWRKLALDPYLWLSVRTWNECRYRAADCAFVLAVLVVGSAMFFLTLPLVLIEAVLNRLLSEQPR